MAYITKFKPGDCVECTKPNQWLFKYACIDNIVVSRGDNDKVLYYVYNFKSGGSVYAPEFDKDAVLDESRTADNTKGGQCKTGRRSKSKRSSKSKRIRKSKRSI